MPKNKIQRHKRLHRMLMMRRNFKLQPGSPGLPMNTHDIHFLLILLTLFLLPLIILQLSLQPRNNILNTGLTLLKRKVPTPVPPSRFRIRF